ncbi:MAG: LCP family protein [Erysipelotrichaceae bacterium]|nr:LCP family protein [Erysipelotrichaceae bacterium]MBR0474866.1 LCP family protein [Erysipelotrichaceae bacterium]
MNNKKIIIKPIPFLIFLLAAGASAFSIYSAMKNEFMPKQIITYFMAALAVINMLCLFLTIFMKRKWLQVILSLLLLVVTIPAALAISMLNGISEHLENIFTTMPETTMENIVLYDRITDSSPDNIADGSYNYAILSNDMFHDINAAISEVNSKAKSASVIPFSNIFQIVEVLNTKDVHQHFIQNSVLIGEDYMEMGGDVWRTDYLMSMLKPVYTVSKEVSTGIIQNEKPDVFNEPFTVLIGGNDVRGSRSDSDYLGRSDINILLAVDLPDRKIGVVMIPRDIYINYNGEANHKDRLTYTSLHGIDKWINAVSDLLNCRIDYFMRFNYSSMEKLIDALGGIELDNSYGFQTYRDVKIGDEYISPQHYFDAGNLTLDGPYTILFIRELMHLTGMYTDQMENTTKVAEAIVNKFKTLRPTGLSEIMGTPEKIINVIDSLDKAAATDLDVMTIVKTALKNYDLTDNRPWQFNVYQPDCYYSYDKCYSAGNYPVLVGKITENTLEISKSIINSVMN